MNEFVSEKIAENVDCSYFLKILSHYNMTIRQERFCQEYVIDMNATKAAKRAGFSKRSAVVTGSKLLKEEFIALYIRELFDRKTERVNKWPKWSVYRSNRKW